MKTSFSVHIESKKVIILGVTSIVPNLNGLLFFTENHRNYQVESYEAQDTLTLHIECHYDGIPDVDEEIMVLDYRK